MKLKIWTPASISESTDDAQLFLRLERGAEEDICLVVVDKSGNKIDRGTILIIEQDLKCLMVMHGLSDKIPLKTNIYSEILQMTEREYIRNAKEESDLKLFSMLSLQICEKQKEDSSKH